MIGRGSGLVLLAGLVVAPARAEPIADCRQNADLSQKFDACTVLLGWLDGEIGANTWAYAERANAACWLGQSDNAVANIWAWFSADPASIRGMQRKLSALGYFDGEIDGGFSGALDQAVVQWAADGCPEAR